jgi:hypothetical protein
MRREPGNFDLYTWGQENVLVSPGMAEAGIADLMASFDGQRSNPIPTRSTLAIALIFASIWTENFAGCSSEKRSPAEFPVSLPCDVAPRRGS